MVEPHDPMTQSERRVIGGALLAIALAWVVFDWANMGSQMGTRAPLWGMDWLRMVLLALGTVVAAFVTLVFGSHRRAGFPLTAFGATVMWACCAYTIWRCYQVQTHQPGSPAYWWITDIGVFLEIAVVFVTLALWKRHGRNQDQDHPA